MYSPSASVPMVFIGSGVGSSATETAGAGTEEAGAGAGSLFPQAASAERHIVVVTITIVAKLLFLIIFFPFLCDDVICYVRILTAAYRQDSRKDRLPPYPLRESPTQWGGSDTLRPAGI